MSLLLPVAGVALMWPFAGTVLFPHQRWASVLVGSAYFWATFLLWIAVLVDWHAPRGRLESPAWSSFRHGHKAETAEVGSSLEAR